MMASQTETAEVTFHSLTLSNNRKFCYSQTGDIESNTVLIFFHGLCGIGNASGVLQNFYKQNKIHSLCPTLPGWGESEPIDESQALHIVFPKMIEELLVHLGKKEDTLRLYISGGSFGTVPAQILFGAPPSVFSFAECVKGLLLLAPFSPFKLHKDYKIGMSTPNWVSIGPLSYYLPFRILPRLLSSILAKKLATLESAEEFLKATLFDNANSAEKEAYAEYRKRYNLPEGYVEKNMAENAVKSVKHSLEGFLMTTTWLHADWGFEPDKITHHNNNNNSDDNKDNEVKVILTVSSGDTSAHEGMALWLEQNYKNASIWRIDGGHLAVLYSIQEITENFLQNELLEKKY